MRPLLSYFAAQEVPAAIVTFVSLLLFLQTGTSPALSTCYSALVSLPWSVKIFVRHHGVRGSRTRLLVSELFILFILVMIALALSPSFGMFRISGVGSGNGLVLFLLLLSLGVCVAWHEVLSDDYYHSHLRPVLRRVYDAPRLFVSQTMVVVVYGILIILVGTLQVISRSIFVSWTIAFLLAAGLMLLFVLWHLAMGYLFRGEAVSVVSGTAVLSAPRPRSIGVRGLILLFLLLLPQSLMFFARVIFLLAPREEGGVSLSLQELGFVHGVVGAMGFAIGLFVSRFFVRRRMRSISVDRRKVGYSQYALKSTLRSTLDHVTPTMLCLRFLPLLLSPLVYLYMSFMPPVHLWIVALCTFLAQFMFGYGLHRLLSYLGLPASLGVRVPVVALLMLLPMALSGWLVVSMSFQHYFLLNVLTASLPFLFLLAGKIMCNEQTSIK